jgi:hypothetical protein
VQVVVRQDESAEHEEEIDAEVARSCDWFEESEGRYELGYLLPIVVYDYRSGRDKTKTCKTGNIRSPLHRASVVGSSRRSGPQAPKMYQRRANQRRGTFAA